MDSDSVAREHLELVESSLESLTSSLSSKIAMAFKPLTSTEVEIAQLSMRGKTTKEIARTLAREDHG